MTRGGDKLIFIVIQTNGILNKQEVKDERPL